ncbi:MAG TPA: thioredoxin family protein [Actinomycetota bacterium]|nr:thioredoxin family protein [Actinomycetota bacterium]
MAATATGLEIGAPAPVSPQMLGVDGRSHTLEEYADAEVLVVVFIGNGCPTVRAYDERLKDLDIRYGAAGMQLIAVNANNAHLSPFDTHAAMVERARVAGLPFPYLKNEDGSLARAMGAVSTPHAFAFDADRRLRYQGRIDDARIAESVTTRDLEEAVKALLAGRRPPVETTEPFGCSIVW